MTENDFYNMCEKVEGAELPTGLGNYYPTVEELKESVEGKPLEELLPVLLFYASDPFKDKIDDEDYKETVKYAINLTGSVPLE